jgi:hypothetical protein
MKYYYYILEHFVLVLIQVCTKVDILFVLKLKYIIKFNKRKKLQKIDKICKKLN